MNFLDMPPCHKDVLRAAMMGAPGSTLTITYLRGTVRKLVQLVRSSAAVADTRRKLSGANLLAPEQSFDASVCGSEDEGASGKHRNGLGMTFKIR